MRGGAGRGVAVASGVDVALASGVGVTVGLDATDRGAIVKVVLLATVPSMSRLTR
jgi:hypothetical protein